VFALIGFIKWPTAAVSICGIWVRDRDSVFGIVAIDTPGDVCHFLIIQ